MKRVEITVKGDRRGRGGKSGRRFGLDKPKKRRDTFSRRKTQTPGIRFYDLGRFANGSTNLHQFIWANGSGPNPGELLSVYSDIANSVFAASDIFTAFFKLTKHDPAAQALILSFGSETGPPASIDQWTDDTLTITDEEAATLSASEDDSSFETASVFFNAYDLFRKVTLEPSYSASEAEFEPSSAMDIALMPFVCRPFGSTELISYVETLNDFYTVFPRSLAPKIEGGSTDYPIVYDRWQQMKNIPNARAFSSDIGFPSIPISSFPDPANFPAPPATPAGTATASYTNDLSRPSGSLSCIVRKNGVIYYFWHG